MATETIAVTNLGAVGYLPDVAPTALPPNGITDARNFRFKEGQFAEVTTGYDNALDSRSKNTLGDDTTTNATFLWTWVLNNNNAIFYYDSQSDGLIYTEQNVNSELVNFRLSYQNHHQKSMVYDSDGTTLTNATNFIWDSDSETVMFQDSDASWDTAVANNADLIIYNRTNKTKALTANISSFTQSNNLFTCNLSNIVTADSDLLPANYGDNYQLFIGTQIQHDNTARFKWSATDALGIPLFNNTLEAPWEFVDDFVPTIRRLTGWPTGGTSDPVCNYLTSFGTTLVAVAYEHPGGPTGYTGSKRTLAFSDIIADAGTTPDWDFRRLTDSTSASAYFDLSLFTDGNVISAVEANNTLYVNTETTVISVVGDGTGNYNGTKLAIGGGVLRSNTSVAIPNGFFTVGNGLIYTHDGNSYQEVGNGKWSESWFSRVDETRIDEVQCIYNPRSHEVWIKTPISTDSQEIWIYNLNADTLSVLDDHQEIKYFHWSADGIPALETTWNTFSENFTWDTLNTDSWNEFAVLVLGDYRNRILSVGGNKLFVHDFGFDFNGRTINAVLQQEYKRLSQNSYGTSAIYRVVPWIDGASGTTTSVRVGGANTTSTPTSWTPYKTFTSGTTQKLDYRKQAKWGGIAFLSTTSGDKISGYEIEIVTQNRR